VAKTDADLRKLSLAELHQKLANFGMAYEEYASLGRWFVRWHHPCVCVYVCMFAYALVFVCMNVCVCCLHSHGLSVRVC
jgi:hypothetical protein